MVDLWPGRIFHGSTQLLTSTKFRSKFLLEGQGNKDGGGVVVTVKDV